MRIHLQSGLVIETNMKHGDFTVLMKDNNTNFIVVSDIKNELKLYNIRKKLLM